MYVTRIEIKNLRAIETLTWSIAEDDAPGWHVVLGENGSGKSTFLRAAALGLIDLADVQALRVFGEDWLRSGSGTGEANVAFLFTPDSDPPPDELNASTRFRSTRAVGGVEFQRMESEARVDLGGLRPGPTYPKVDWHRIPHGWFAAGFGPFRRFTGGDPDSEQLTQKRPRLARVLSLFDERFVLSDTLQWIADLRFASLRDPNDDRFERVKRFVNEGEFLPRGVTLVDAEPPRKITFRDANGFVVPVEQLADGFRSFLSLLLELLRHVMIAFPKERVFDPAAPSRVIAPGVVFIDEVDAHLHPTWQRSIGAKLTQAFPRMQFIVTTHSPLVCRSAARGSIFVLPSPGEEGEGRFLTETEKTRLVLGNVLDAYGTGVFGVGVDQSDEGRARLDRLAALNVKELDAALSEDEERERNALRSALPSRAATMRASH